MEIELNEKTTDEGKLKTQYKGKSSWAKQSLEAATEMFWKNRCSYRQLFWKGDFQSKPSKNIFEEVCF